MKCCKYYYSHRWARLRKRQTSITVYRLLTKENKLPFSFLAYKRMVPFSVLIYISILKRQHVYIYIDIYTYIHTSVSMYIYIYLSISKLYLYIYAAVSNGKRKPRWFSFTRLPFAHHANGFVVCPFITEETNGSFPFSNGLNRLGHLWLS